MTILDELEQAARKATPGCFPPIVESDRVEFDAGSGCIAIIDAADWEQVSRLAWRAEQNRPKTHWYVRSMPRKTVGHQRSTYLHRLLLNAPAGVLVDHVNGNGLDNRRANLRFSNPTLNGANRVKKSGPKSSAYKGVYATKDCKTPRWAAATSSMGKTAYLGTYTDEALAALAFDCASIESYGEHARTNFPHAVIRHVLELRAALAKLDGGGA